MLSVGEHVELKNQLAVIEKQLQHRITICRNRREVEKRKALKQYEAWRQAVTFEANAIQRDLVVKLQDQLFRRRKRLGEEIHPDEVPLYSGKRREFLDRSHFPTQTTLIVPLNTEEIMDDLRVIKGVTSYIYENRQDHNDHDHTGHGHNGNDGPLFLETC